MSDWMNRSVPCVVMCGGRSSRFGSRDRHKSMATVGERPLIEVVVSYWSRFADDFIFVVKHGGGEMRAFLEGLPVNSRFVEPDDLRGCANGLSYVEPLITDRFIVVLGDCFCQGEFDLPESFGSGIGVWRTGNEAEIRRNYMVHAKNGLVERVVEKPERVVSDLCGLGFYFFQPSIFQAIRDTEPSERTGEVEITEVLQTIVDSGAELSAIPLEGHYVNVTTPEDLARVEALLGGSG